MLSFALRFKVRPMKLIFKLSKITTYGYKPTAASQQQQFYTLNSLLKTHLRAGGDWRHKRRIDRYINKGAFLSVFHLSGGSAALSFSLSTSRRSWTQPGWSAQVFPWRATWSCCCGPSLFLPTLWEASLGLWLLVPWPSCWEGKKC